MKTIGRTDRVDFPELELRNIKAKVDTGAYTSSIHCLDIKEIEINEEKWIEFKLLDPSHIQYNNKVFKVKNYTEKIVKSSFGHVESRFIIETDIIIFAEQYKIELSLSERSSMKYPILLGRKFLTNNFIVDTADHNLSYKLKKEKIDPK